VGLKGSAPNSRKSSDVLWSVLCCSAGSAGREFVCTGSGLYIDIKISRQTDMKSVCNCFGNTVIVGTF
jgi:hypothetical protein